MAKINENYLKLKSSYLFSEIARRVREFQDAHPDARIIRLGIGDVTQPLPPAVIKALHEAVDEMAKAETFRGYGPDAGCVQSGGQISGRPLLLSAEVCDALVPAASPL